VDVVRLCLQRISIFFTLEVSDENPVWKWRLPDYSVAIVPGLYDFGKSKDIPVWLTRISGVSLKIKRPHPAAWELLYITSQLLRVE
jgi:hypothetical protein